MSVWKKVEDPLGPRRGEYVRRERAWMLCVWLPCAVVSPGNLWRWASYDASGFVGCSSTTEDTATPKEAMGLADAWLIARLGADALGESR